MGDGKRKKAVFKAEHPWCCFCGGGVPTTTIDHIPARACFRNREYPDGFEFPACDHCQRASRIDEIAFAFWVRALDHNDANLTQRDFDRLLGGVMNNLPGLLPQGIASRQRKREALRRMGARLQPGFTLDQAPIVNVDPQIHAHFERYARKIALALFYREQKRIAKSTHRIAAAWGQASDPAFMGRSRDFYRMTPLVTIGGRPNIDIGNQFRYQCNKANDPDVFAALAEFGSGGVVLQMIVASQDAALKLDKLRDMAGDPVVDSWVSVSDNYPRPKMQ